MTRELIFGAAGAWLWSSSHFSQKKIAGNCPSTFVHVANHRAFGGWQTSSCLWQGMVLFLPWLAVADWHGSSNHVWPINPWQNPGTRMVSANPTTLCANNDRAKWGSGFHMNSASSSMVQPCGCHTENWLEPQRHFTIFSCFVFLLVRHQIHEFCPSRNLFFARSSGLQVTFDHRCAHRFTRRQGPSGSDSGTLVYSWARAEHRCDSSSGRLAIKPCE